MANIKDLKKITDLLRYGDGKFLVVEDGEPSFVVMDIEQFKKMKQNQEDEYFDAEEFMRNLDWDDEDRYDIDRYSVFDDNDEFDEDYKTDEDDEEGFSSDDIPFEDFLKDQADAVEEEKQENKKDDEIIIEPLSNSVSSDNSEKQEEKQEEKPNVNLNDIPF